MKKSVKLPLLLLALAVFPVFSLPAAAQKHQALYEEAFKLYKHLYSDSDKAKRAETWDLIGRTFYRIYRENPRGKNAAWSLFLAAKVHEDKSRRFRSPGDAEKARRYSLELVRRYPKSSLADDSQFRAARVLERRGEKTRAYVAYRKIVREMPDGTCIPGRRKSSRSSRDTSPRRLPPPHEKPRPRKNPAPPRRTPRGEPPPSPCRRDSRP